MSANVLTLKPSPDETRRDPSAALWRRLSEALRLSPAVAEVALTTPGRGQGSDGFHFVCEAVAIGARGLKIVGALAADPGDAVTTHFRDLGEIRGVVESRGDDWFVLAPRETPERIETLARRLEWIVRRHKEGMAERRMSPRFEQDGRRTVLKTSDGREIAGRLLDLSATGAAVGLEANAPFFWVGQDVKLDERSARVRRHFPGGIGLEFDAPRAVEG